jgi:hypothetical protein
MPKLYEYFGLVIFFYANEHEPVHVHGRYQGRESRADIRIVNGVITEIVITNVAGKRPLAGRQRADFQTVVERYAADVVRKWIAFFVHHKPIRPQTITRRLS